MLMLQCRAPNWEQSVGGRRIIMSRPARVGRVLTSDQSSVEEI